MEASDGTEEGGPTTVWGIDLGTTYSCIARVKYERAEIVNNDEGDPITPSVVMFVDADTVRVGKAAKQQLLMDPDNVCELVKRSMDDPDWRFSAHGKEWTAPEVSAQILKAIAAGAESQTREKVERVVITVPAYFGVSEREATKAAGKIAALDVVDIINEPTAAAFSYGFGEGGGDETILVYDLGGGTFDISVIILESEGGRNRIRVVATGGNHRLGGAQWDGAVVELLARKFMEAHPEADDPLDAPIPLGELKLAAEDVKRALSTRDAATQIVVSGSVRDNVEITREEFDQATESLLMQTIEFTRKTVEEAKALGATEIDRVLLVGGSTFMPQVPETLRQEFGWEPELEDPNQSVAKGAALFGMRAGIREMLEDAIEEAEASGGSAEAAKRAVAEEAGISVGTLDEVSSTEVVNVCSRGFGIAVLRDGSDPSATIESARDQFFIDHLIGPNAPLPATPDEQRYGTTVDNQTQAQVQLWEQAGTELSDAVGDNRKIGEGIVLLSGSDARGAPIHVTLALDESGVLRCTARDGRGEMLEFQVEPDGAVLSKKAIAEATERAATVSRI